MILKKWENEIAITGIKRPVSVKMEGVNTKLKIQFKNAVLNIESPLLNPITMPCEYAWVHKLENAL